MGGVVGHANGERSMVRVPRCGGAAHVGVVALPLTVVWAPMVWR